MRGTNRQLRVFFQNKKWSFNTMRLNSVKKRTVRHATRVLYVNWTLVCLLFDFCIIQGRGWASTGEVSWETSTVITGPNKACTNNKKYGKLTVADDDKYFWRSLGASFTSDWTPAFLSMGVITLVYVESSLLINLMGVVTVVYVESSLLINLIGGVTLVYVESSLLINRSMTFPVAPSYSVDDVGMQTTPRDHLMAPSKGPVVHSKAYSEITMLIFKLD